MRNNNDLNTNRPFHSAPIEVVRRIDSNGECNGFTLRRRSRRCAPSPRGDAVANPRRDLPDEARCVARRKFVSEDALGWPAPLPPSMRSFRAPLGGHLAARVQPRGRAPRISVHVRYGPPPGQKLRRPIVASAGSGWAGPSTSALAASSTRCSTARMAVRMLPAGLSASAIL